MSLLSLLFRWDVMMWSIKMCPISWPCYASGLGTEIENRMSFLTSDLKIIGCSQKIATV